MNTQQVVPVSVRIFAIINIIVGGVFTLLNCIDVIFCSTNFLYGSGNISIDFVSGVAIIVPLLMLCFGILVYRGRNVLSALFLFYTIIAVSCFIELFHVLMVTHTLVCNSLLSSWWVFLIGGFVWLVVDKNFRSALKTDNLKVGKIILIVLIIVIGTIGVDYMFRSCEVCDEATKQKESEVANKNYDGSISDYTWQQYLDGVAAKSAYLHIQEKYRQKFFDDADIDCDEDGDCTIGDGLYNIYRLDVDNDTKKELVIVSYQGSTASLVEIFDEQKSEWVPRNVKKLFAGNTILNVSNVYPVSFIKNENDVNQIVFFGPFKILELRGNVITDVTTTSAMFDFAMSSFVGSQTSLSIIDELLDKDPNNFNALVLAETLVANNIDKDDTMLSKPTDSMKESIATLSKYDGKLQALYNAGNITSESDIMQYYESRGKFEYVSLDWKQAKEYWNKCVDEEYPIHYFCDIGLIKIAIAEHEFKTADAHITKLEKYVKGNAYIEGDYTYSTDDLNNLRTYLESARGGDVSTDYERSSNCSKESSSNTEDKLRAFVSSHGFLKEEARYADHVCNVQITDVEKGNYVGVVSIKTFDRYRGSYGDPYIWIGLFNLNPQGEIQKLAETKNLLNYYYEPENIHIIPKLYHDTDNNSFIGIDFVDVGERLQDGLSNVTNARIFAVDYKNSSLTSIIQTVTTIECTDKYLDNNDGAECASLWAAIKFVKTKHNGRYDIEKYLTPETLDIDPSSMIYKWNGKSYESTTNDIFDSKYQYVDDYDD